MPSKATDEGAPAPGPGATPTQPHPTVLKWARWVAGPYAPIAGRSTYAQDLHRWEVDFEEYPMKAEATTEQLAALVAAAGLDLDRTAAVRALGAYAARKQLQPDMQELPFTGIPSEDTAGPKTGNTTTDQGRMGEIVALISAQKLEVEQMRHSLIPPLTQTVVDRFLTRPYHMPG